MYYAPSPAMTDLHENFIQYWGPISGFTAEQEQTLRDGGYYSVLAKPGLRILAINSNYA